MLYTDLYRRKPEHIQYSHQDTEIAERQVIQKLKYIMPCNHIP